MEFQSILLNILYMMIIGIGVNLFVELFKNENGGKLTILLAWCIGAITCLLLGFDFFYRIGLVEIKYYFFDFIFTGFLTANVSRFIHKLSEFMKQYKEVKNGGV